MNKIHKPIPGYDKYAVSEDGEIISLERRIVLGQNLLDGYMTVHAFRGSKTKTLPVHRAVALAWIKNPDPDNLTVVNHIDTDRTNNHVTNLEWTDYSGNNYHAIAQGVRSDAIPVLLRDFETGQIIIFDSMAQAAVFLGFKKDAGYSRLRPAKFGKLVKDRWEVRFRGDPVPWFYEGRSEKIPPARYWITVKESDGVRREFFKRSELLKAYQLYDCEESSIPALVDYARIKYPDFEFYYKDAFEEPESRIRRLTKLSNRIQIQAKRGTEVKTFSSLTKCAFYFGVDRSVVLMRLETGKEFKGWMFTKI